jgi:hypothetical protein
MEIRFLYWSIRIVFISPKLFLPAVVHQNKVTTCALYSRIFKCPAAMCQMVKEKQTYLMPSLLLKPYLSIHCVLANNHTIVSIPVQHFISRYLFYFSMTCCLLAIWFEGSVLEWLYKQIYLPKKKTLLVFLCLKVYKLWSQGSSVSTVTMDWTTRVRSLTEAEDFSSSVCIQTGSGAHPASCPMGTRGLFLGVKRGQGMMLTTHPHLVPTLRMSRSYTSSPPRRLHGI